MRNHIWNWIQNIQYGFWGSIPVLFPSRLILHDFAVCTSSVAVCQSCSDLRRKRTSTETDDVEATHRSVEEIISRISDPNLDCSLEDIEVVPIG